MGWAGKVVADWGGGFELDERGHGLSITSGTGQQRHSDAVNTTVAAKDQQGVDRAAFKGAVQAVTGFEGEAGGVVAVAGAGAHPAFFGDDDRHRRVHHLSQGVRLKVARFDGDE